MHKTRAASGVSPDVARENDAALILDAGIAAAAPRAILSGILKKNAIIVGKNVIKTSQYRAIRIVSFGKAGLSMALAFDGRIRARDGIIVIPEDVPAPRRSKFHIIKSTHPDPAPSSVRAADAIISFIQKCRSDELVVFLVSGGASALVASPDGITLSEKIMTNQLLLKSGANIAEVNCVRKHLSKIKGGHLVSRLSCDAVALLMSDVKANDMTVIASGITYCDRTTFSDAQRILKKYRLDLQVPGAVMRHLESGIRRRISDTPKRAKIRNFVIASNKNCTNAMKKKAQSLGYDAKTTTVFGKVERQAEALARLAPTKSKSCLIFGGETTVMVRGNGSGGRNQELVMRIADMVRGDLVIGSVGTDGIDGNTRYAGAMIRTSQIDKSKISSYLKTNNSCAYFKKYGGLVETGPTQTNLLDIGLVIS